MTRDQTASLHGLILAAAKAFEAHGSDIAQDISRQLSGLDWQEVAPLPGGSVPQTLARLNWPETTWQATLLACAADLHWRKPGFGALPEAVVRNIDVAEVVGPNGMIPHDTVRFGVLLQGADHNYPEHSHAAEELYCILAGRAHWSVEGSDPQSQGPGAFVHHKPWQAHATRTGSEPMLALWGWTGDIGSNSYGMRG